MYPSPFLFTQAACCQRAAHGCGCAPVTHQQLERAGGGVLLGASSARPWSTVRVWAGDLFLVPGLPVTERLRLSRIHNPLCNTNPREATGTLRVQQELGPRTSGLGAQHPVCHAPLRQASLLGLRASPRSTWPWIGLTPQCTTRSSASGQTQRCQPCRLSSQHLLVA